MTTAPPRSDQLVHPLARQVMGRAEEVHGLAVDAAPPVAPFGDATPETLARIGRTQAQDRADEELGQLLWLLERSDVERKARDQLRWSAGDARADEACPTCGAGPRQAHGALPHQVVDERAEAGYRPCGCNPDVHDHIGACVRAARHHGPCAAEEPDAGEGVPAVVVFACRSDDAAPHA